MKQNIIVLSVNPYQMNNGGNIVEGVSVSYLTVDNLNPLKDGQALGTRPAKANLPYGWKDLFLSAPAMYEAELTMKVGSDGKPVMSISHIDFMGELTCKMNTPASAK